MTTANAAARSGTTATPAAMAVVRRDFPSWLPPMLVKELRQGLQTRGFVAAFIIFQVIMVIMMAGTLAGLPDANPAARATAVSSSNAFFWGLMSALLLAVIPGRALFGLKGEIDSRTLDLLVLTRLTAWRIVLGKWASLVAQGTLLLVAMLPYGIARYFAGSVDLFADGRTCLALLGGCAILTGLGLWLSVLPRVAMFAIVIGGFIFFINGQGLGRTLTRSLAGTRMLPTLPNDATWLLVTDGAILLFFFLIAAVRRIAPPAENHAPSLRVLALAALASVPLLERVSSTSAAQFQFHFAGIFLALVAAIELANTRRPMGVHWQAFSQRSGLLRFAGRLLLPGWPSALVFTVMTSALFFATAWTSSVITPAQLNEVWYMAPLVLAALVFPVVVISFVKRTRSTTFAIYGLVIGVMSLGAALTFSFTNTTFMPRWFPDFASMLPITGFWLSFARPITPLVAFGQIVVACIVLVLSWIRARPYWNELADIDAGQREGA